MLVMSVFSLITPSSDVLKPTKTPVERGEGLCVRGLNRGTVGQALVTHRKELTVLNTPGGAGLLALVLLVYQGGHPPDGTCVLSGTGCYVAHWDFSTSKTFCFISSFAAWQNHEED